MPSTQDKKTRLWRWRDYFDVKGDGVKVRVSAPGRYKKKGEADEAGDARIKQLTEEREKAQASKLPVVSSKTEYQNYRDFFLNRFYPFYVFNKLNSGSEQESKYTIFVNWLDKPFGDIPLNHLSFESIESVRTSWLQAGSAPKSINNRMTVLLTSLKYAHKCNLLDLIPQIEFYPDDDEGDIEVFEFEEYARFIRAAQVIGPYTYLIALLAGEANLRRGEIIELRWEDIDMVGQVLTIRRQYRSAKTLNRETGLTERKGIISQGKSRRRRTITITNRLFDALNSLPGERKGLVVFHTGEGLSRKSRTAYGTRISGKVMDRLFRRICEVAGLPLPPLLKKGEKREGPRQDGKAWHKLRHTWATHALQCGMDPYHASKLMGHEDFETTKGYEHFAEAHKRIIPDVMLGAGEGLRDPNQRAFVMLSKRADLCPPDRFVPPSTVTPVVVVVHPGVRPSGSDPSTLN